MTTGTFILQTIVEGRIKRKCEEEREKLIISINIIKYKMATKRAAL